MIKKSIIIFIILNSFAYIQAQEPLNVNPDPNGEPWIISGFFLEGEGFTNYFDLPILQLTPESESTPLLAIVDNSQYQFMRDIFNQSSPTQPYGSCGQASGIGYTFTYEINRLRNFPSNIDENIFAHHYTWNFINAANPITGGSPPWAGWKIAKYNGCPNLTTWGGLYVDHLQWMDEYNEYLTGQQYRVTDIYRIPLGETIEDLNLIKHWLSDHNEGVSIGGLVNFGTRINPDAGVEYDILSDDNGNQSGKPVVVEWGKPLQGTNPATKDDHAMTFVGYNENIKYDYNGDGQYTNDVDILGLVDMETGVEGPDGVIDLRDCEIGAFLVANSWGTNWPGAEYLPPNTETNGYAWMPYRAIFKSYMDDFGTIQWINIVDGVAVAYVKYDYVPQIMIKVKILYPCRRLLSAYAGVAPYANSNTYIENLEIVPLNYNKGGSVYMNGYSGTNKIIIL